MQKSKIEWCDYTINPVKGLCPVGCSYCYARRMYKRFGWNPEIRYDDMVWQTGGYMPKGSKIFIGSTIDLFHDKTIQFLPTIMDYVECLKAYTFIFLTKCPQNLPSKFPDNCWVGVSVTNPSMLSIGLTALHDVNAKVKFISAEPLLERIQITNLRGIDWLIIGQQTPSSVKTSPQMAWIQDLLVAASNADNIPVFMKNNLKPLLTGVWSGWNIRQEYPRKES